MPRTLLDLTCQSCGCAYQRPVGGTGMTYCSTACAVIGRRKRGLVPKGRVIDPVPCAWCGTMFHPINGRRATHIYCDQVCRDHGRRQPIREMCETELAWLAGLFDGEGHISLDAKLNKKSRGYKIQITNTCRPLMDKVLEITGVGSITTRYHDNPRHKPTHDWHNTGGNAVEIIRRMRPWLIAKAERADQVLSSGRYELKPKRERNAVT